MSDPFDLNRYAVGGHPEAPEPGAGAPTPASLAVGEPPVGWLFGAVLAAVAGALAAVLLFRTGPVTILPWLLAGPVAIVLLGVFSTVDTRRRAMPVYAAASWVKPLSVAATVVILVAVIVTAVDIAFWIGRL